MGCGHNGVGFLRRGRGNEDERSSGGGDEGRGIKDYRVTDDVEDVNHQRGLRSTFKSSSDSFAGLGLILQHTWASGLTSATGRVQMEVFDLLMMHTHPSLYYSDSDNWFYGAEEDGEIAAAAGVYILKMPSLDHGARKKKKKKPLALTNTHISSTCEDKHSPVNPHLYLQLYP